MAHPESEDMSATSGRVEAGGGSVTNTLSASLLLRVVAPKDLAEIGLTWIRDGGGKGGKSGRVLVVSLPVQMPLFWSLMFFFFFMPAPPSKTRLPWRGSIFSFPALILSEAERPSLGLSVGNVADESENTLKGAIAGVAGEEVSSQRREET